MRKQTQKAIMNAIAIIHQNLVQHYDNGTFNPQIINILNQIKDACNNELSSTRNEYYVKILDGLIMAISTLADISDVTSKQQIIRLSIELIERLNMDFIKEPEVKLEIVFLPYKASMWDSLESIWKAANDDKEHCNAYVVPIPYTDRNPDGTAADWHCERDLFPKYVPVLKWEEVDLEKLHPDIIFIHNPYDANNAATSVSSQYYSSELKKYTDKLIYIPYFVLSEIEPGNEEAEEGIAHFITAPAILIADFVIVQSEKMRQVYINVLMRHTTQQDRKYWEEHILGIGSPKFDRVISTKKEDIEIPEKWLRIITKPDKTFKKVVFYNTGLTAMLEHEEMLLNKIKKVFKIFKMNRSEVALLWRPHPLMLAAINSLRPRLKNKYNKMVSQYKKDGWGIYDDTADVDRAIAISDAYYGDKSSVVELFKVVGKPIMLQNVSKQLPE